jgi:P27 family predicted phage terminase small subunit
MGRNPKPEWLHSLQGTTPQGGPGVSAHVGGRPVMPKDLPEAGQKEWRRLVKELGKQQKLCKVDRSILEVHCRVYGMWRLACDDIEKRGINVESVVLDSNGEAHHKVVQNPSAKLAQQLTTQLRNTLAQLSATPSSREKAKRTIAPPPRPPAGQDPDPILDI